MDELGLRVLHAEMLDDAAIIADAARTAESRLEGGSAPEIEGAAFHLARAYNALERMALRVAKAFENQVNDREGRHIGLLRRLALDVPGVRPALFPRSLLPAIQDLRAFRHVFRHAYDLRLDPERLGALASAAEQVAVALPEHIAGFVQAVAVQEGWRLDDLPAARPRADE